VMAVSGLWDGCLDCGRHWWWWWTGAISGRKVLLSGILKPMGKLLCAVIVVAVLIWVVGLCIHW